MLSKLKISVRDRLARRDLAERFTAIKDLPGYNCAFATPKGRTISAEGQVIAYETDAEAAIFF
jgi:hypothetical protein